MSRSNPVTDAEIASAAASAEESAADIRYLAERFRKNIGAEGGVSRPLSYARAFASLAMAASDLGHALLVKESFEEDRRELKATIEARLKQERDGQ